MKGMCHAQEAPQEAAPAPDAASNVLPGHGATLTSRDFCYWLQGYLEIGSAVNGVPGLTEAQLEIVQNHLALVFVHEIDPSMGPPEHQDKLNDIHQKPKPQIGGYDSKGRPMRC